MKTVNREPFAPNLAITEILFRHFMLMAIGILAGILNVPALIFLGLPFFMTAMAGWCPIYQYLGINHHK